ncbi:putative ibr finger domain-containing protein [Golovinomyces cichoracearum]|uniref:Putative ibr finger domain-containing protein n=1 Tax=Golovinomyces cichoracearum TaxID=62708 RepID=A0A420H8G4_9PEZI|nr:putative ibr finger domain-containing protein [Golovinomyces cichoracearum]
MADLPIPGKDEIYVLQLELEEIQEYHERSKGKWNENNAPDSHVALVEYEFELKSALMCLEDARIAHSIAQAIYSDAPMIRQIENEEYQSQQDRNYALQIELHGEIPEIQTSAKKIENNNFGDEIEAALSLSPEEIAHDSMKPSSSGLAMNDSLKHFNLDIAYSTVQYALHQQELLHKLFLRRYVCVACTEIISPGGIISVNCINNETIFPPKCCGISISFALIKSHLTENEERRFLDAQLEYSSVNRIYCSRTDCGRFIVRKDLAKDRARCGVCNHETCIHCKGPSHLGECPDDKALKSLISLASQNKWIRCYQCWAMIERLQGCYHMT